MKKLSRKIITLFFSTIIVVGGCDQSKKEGGALLTPKQNRRPGNYKLSAYKYSLEELKKNFSEDMMQLAANQYKKVEEVNNRGKWSPTPESIDRHKAPEWFTDAKFGMFIDWGLWSVAGWAPIREKKAMYPDWYEFRLDTDTSFISYHNKNWGNDFKRDDFIPLFTANRYEPRRLVDIAKVAGMKYIVPFCKHHGGFCLWPSSFTQRDAGDMGPRKDLINPLVEACKKEGLKFGFYFSIEEWEYPVIDSNEVIQNRIWKGDIIPYSPDLEKRSSGKIAVKDFVTDYLVPQATEFIDRYDPDILWYDGDWSTSAEELQTYNIAAYFYNNAEGRKEVAVNDRYGKQNEKWLRSVRGDFFTNEYGDMDKDAKQAFHAWEECRGISQSFGYNWQDTDENVVSSKEFIDMFVDIVAHGGNLLLIVNLDGVGALPEVQERRLKDIGTWLKVNGEGIYATRPFYPYKNGTINYTRSKDGKFVYVIMKEWPGSELHLNDLKAGNGSKIEMLGYGKTLNWENDNEGVSIKFPEKLQNPRNRPCDHAWVLKISL
jgi:alpha-L-fucosidase